MRAFRFDSLYAVGIVWHSSIFRQRNQKKLKVNSTRTRLTSSYSVLSTRDNVVIASWGVSGSIQPAETTLGAVAPRIVTANTTIIAAAVAVPEAVRVQAGE